MVCFPEDAVSRWDMEGRGVREVDHNRYMPRMGACWAIDRRVRVAARGLVKRLANAMKEWAPMHQVTKCR